MTLSTWKPLGSAWLPTHLDPCLGIVFHQLLLFPYVKGLDVGMPLQGHQQLPTSSPVQPLPPKTLTIQQLRAVGKVIRNSAHLGHCMLRKLHTWFRSQRKWLQGGSLASSLVYRTHLWSSKRPPNRLRLVQGHAWSSSHPGFQSMQQVWEGPWEKHKMKEPWSQAQREKRDSGRRPPFCSWQASF